MPRETRVTGPEAIDEAAEELAGRHGTQVRVEGRSIVLVQPVKGDPGLAVLKALGLAQAAPAVGAAAHGDNGVAIGVWARPELYLVRWAKGKRWMVGYKLASGNDPNTYIRTEGHIPSRFEVGHWYGNVPEDIAYTFSYVGLDTDAPPFEPPPPPPVTASGPPPFKARPKPRAASSRPAATPRAPKAPAAAWPRKPLSRVCPSCRMAKAPAQFVAGSELCVDCR